MGERPQAFSDAADVAGTIIERLNGRVVLGLLANESSHYRRLFGLILRGVTVQQAPYADCMERLQILKPRTPTDWIYRFLILGALAQTENLAA